MSELGSALGSEGSGRRAFTLLQRPWLWDPSGPPLGPRVRSQIEPLGLQLPAVATRARSTDGSLRLLLEAGPHAFEVVHMPRDVAAGRVTVCVSSQAGCAMGCAFCATAQLGLGRHLSAGEMVAEVLLAMRLEGPRHPGELTLVFMGMGEPLHNLEAVRKAIAVLCDPAGLGLSPRRITVSTSGLIPEIAELSTWETRPLLAISLNATTDEVRSRLMPVNRRYPMALLAQSLRAYPLRARERITVEYVLLGGVNDTPADAERLARFCAFPHLINLIPFNPFPGSSFVPPAEHSVDAFARALLAHGSRLVTVRRSRGQDIQAACGQLARGTASEAPPR